jgi:AraC-like DNA-binding protein
LRPADLRKHNRFMLESAAHPKRIRPDASTASAIAALSVSEYDRDRSLIAIPRHEVHIVARFGPSARNGLDIHAMGAQQRVRRKLIRAGQRAVTVRLHLGAAEAVLGVPASAITGRIIALDDLWGGTVTQRLLNELATTRTASSATTLLETAIAERLARVDARHSHSPLALQATARLTRASVKTVAADLGVSERQLRRVFLQTVGVTPKAYSRLARFHRALRTAREDRHTTWASIAAAAGYYDQAHLIEDFHSIAGVTPRALLAELDLPGWQYPT